MAGKRGVIPKHVTRMQFNHPGSQFPLIQILEGIEDPRKPSKFFRYSLTSVLFMTLVGYLCGANEWHKIVILCESLNGWLADYVDMSHGVPCERTFKNIFNAVDPKAMESALRDLASLIRKKTPQETISFDGQTGRGTADRQAGRSGLHLLSAWHRENGICLGQLKVDDKSNEITAIVKLMDLLDLKGTVITADALNTQKAVAEKAVEKGAYYLLPVKRNQPSLLEEIKSAFDDLDRELAVARGQWEWNVAKAREQQDHSRLKMLHAQGVVTRASVHSESEKGHGRIETRSCEVIGAKELPSLGKWKGLKSIARVRRERTVHGNGTRVETMYYITSLGEDATLIAETVRGHWDIENGLHWCLDVVFKQDQSRYRDRIGAENAAVFRKIALNGLKQETSQKRSIAGKMWLAALDPTYRATVLKNLF